MPVVLGAKPPLKTVLNSNPLGKIAINRAETIGPHVIEPRDIV